MAAPAAPPGRGYELVSPQSKNGGDVMAETSRTRASVTGDAVEFASLVGFSDVRGTSIAAEYLSQRTGTPGTPGWSTHSVMPLLEPLSTTGAINNLEGAYQGELSDDLSKGIFRTYTNIENVTNEANVPNLYVRDGMLTPGPGSFELLTHCLVCGSPLPVSTVIPYFADATPDFGHVLFESTVNLLPGVTGFRTKLYEWDHGTLRLAGVLPGGAPATCPDGQSCSFAGADASRSWYTHRTISDDGSRIIFTVPNVNNTFGQVGNLYLNEDGTSVQINASEKTVPDGAQDARFETASADGSKIFFSSSEQLTDTVGSGLYMYDVDSSPHLTLISVDNEVNDFGQFTGVAGASDDGSYLYYYQTDQLVAGEPLINGDGNGIYLWHNGVTKYLGTLHEDGGDDVGSNSVTHAWNLRRLSGRVSANGQTLMFQAHTGTGLTGYNHGKSCSSISTDGQGPCTELYVYNIATDELTCASCRPDGVAATGDATVSANSGIGGAGTTSHLNHPLSDDGQHLFFDTSEALLPADQNGKKNDVYEYDVATQTLHLISTGKSPSDSYFLDASRDARDVFFASRQSLVGWDTDDGYDLYDARLGGGFPEPPPPPIAECDGEACQGAITPSPLAATPPSSLFFQGSDNVKPAKVTKPKKCAKGKVRKRVHGKVKCVKKKHAKGKTAKRSSVQRRAK